MRFGYTAAELRPYGLLPPIAGGFDAHTPNFAYSTVLTPPAPAASGFTLAVQAGNGALFPATPFNAVVCPAGTRPTAANAEIVRCTALAADTFTIARTQEGTSARTIAAGDQFFAAATSKTFTDLEAMTHGKPGSVYRNAALTTTANTWNVMFDTLARDDGGLFVTASGLYLCKIPVTGWYRCEAEFLTGSLAVGQRVLAAIVQTTSGGVYSAELKRGTDITNATLNALAGPTVAATLYLTANTYIVAAFYPVTNNIGLAVGSAVQNYFSVQQMG